MPLDTPRLPDFLIVGAMKAGTSSLHHILDSHPGIYLPKTEIFFFDLDDIHQHPDFFVHTQSRWWHHDFEINQDKYLDWYASFFESAEDTQLVGEDSTTYLSSRKAPQRISRVLPEVKIIALLRDPASRTYSHYWHLVRTGRAVFSFEDQLQIAPANMIERSLYLEQTSRFLKYFPRKNLKFVFFEDFVDKMEEVVVEVFRFLALGKDEPIDLSEVDSHQNRARTPHHLKLQLLRNRLFRRRALNMYAGRLPDFPQVATNTTEPGLITRLLDRALSSLNSFTIEGIPSMRPETRQFLDRYFAQENRGLEKILGRPIPPSWYPSQK